MSWRGCVNYGLGPRSEIIIIIREHASLPGEMDGRVDFSVLKRFPETEIKRRER